MTNARDVVLMTSDGQCWSYQPDQTWQTRAEPRSWERFRVIEWTPLVVQTWNGQIVRLPDLPPEPIEVARVVPFCENSSPGPAPLGPWNGNVFAYQAPYQFMFTLQGWSPQQRELGVRQYIADGFSDLPISLWQELRPWSDGRGGTIQYPSGSQSFDVRGRWDELAALLEQLHGWGARSCLTLHSKHRLGGQIPLMDQGEWKVMVTDCLSVCSPTRVCVGWESNRIAPELNGEDDHRWAYSFLRNAITTMAHLPDDLEIYDHFTPERDVASKNEDTNAQRQRAKAVGLSGYLLQTHYTQAVEDSLDWLYVTPSPHGQAPGIVGRNAAHGLLTVAFENRRNAAGHRDLVSRIPAGRGYGFC